MHGVNWGSVWFEKGRGHESLNSWACGTHSLTHALPLPKWIGCHRLGYLQHLVPKTLRGSVLSRSWGDMHKMGSTMHQGVKVSWGEV